jgi:putative CocE/NonD family hydrolase
LLVRDDLLDRIEEIENLFIPMSDGCQLAARVWLPKGAREKPVPAILEYLPYRKRDWMRERDEAIHRYFAGHGYATLRVDLRGSGDSDGVLTDEYTRIEHEDALELIAWIAEQPWCDGAVGMFGISWGGFNALQVAARRPPALKAIITLCSSDDRYADDAHYMGGCLLNENLQWGAVLMSYNALPPDPDIVGERWRDMWLERLQHAVPFPALWMRHPFRDDYWRHGSVCEDYRAVICPVYAIGGWADGYSNAVPRLLSGLSCPKKGLIGPWSHSFPHSGVPGPAIGFMQEALRWWDQWLRGQETGIMAEPLYRVWMQQSVPPGPHYEVRPGRWVAEHSWPSPRIEWRRWYLNPGRMQDEAAQPVALSFSSPQTTGMVAGEWCAFGSHGEMPLDQRMDDGRCLVFDSEPLEAPLEILGAPIVELELSASTKVAMVAVRLNDVAPGGASTRVTYGLLNLTHREGHEQPQPLIPGEKYRVRVKLNDTAHSFAKGHAVRVAISTCYWPIAWPPPEPVLLTVWSAVSSVELPLRPPDPDDNRLPEFAEPESAPRTRYRPLRRIPFKRTVERDLTTDEMIYTLASDGGEFGGHSLARLDEIDLDLGYTVTRRHRIYQTDPLSAKSELRQELVMRRTAWHVRVKTRVELSAARDHLVFLGELEAFEGNELVHQQSWEIKVPRLLF